MGQIPLQSWRYIVRGYEAKIERQRELAAWSVSYLLVGAGCDADKVTPARLLGRDSADADEDTVEQKRVKFDRFWARAQKKEAAAQQQKDVAVPGVTEE